MLSLNTSSSIASFITLFLAYLLAVGLMGFINAWIGKMVGDTTAEDHGLLTFDPFVHIDPIGFLLLLFSGIGWSKMVPIQISYITEPYRKLKISFALFGETVLGLVIAFIGICIVFMIGLGPNNGLIVGEPSSLLIAIQLIFLRFIFLILFMAIAQFLFGLVRLLILLLSKNYQQYAAFLSEISFFVAFALFFIFARYLQILCISGLVSLCTLLGQLTGFSL